MEYISMEKSQDYLDRTIHMMRDGSFSNVAHWAYDKFGVRATNKIMSEYHVKGRDELWRIATQRASHFMNALANATSATVDHDLTMLYGYWSLIKQLRNHPFIDYWTYQDDTKLTKVRTPLAVAIVKSLILSSNVQHPALADYDGVHARVRSLMDRHRTAQALDQLYCQYGDMVTTELDDMHFMTRQETLACLQDHLKTAVKTRQDTDGTTGLKDILSYIDRVERSNEPYWELGEHDREVPRPIDHESMSLLISNVIEFSSED